MILNPSKVFPLAGVRSRTTNPLRLQLVDPLADNSIFLRARCNHGGGVSGGLGDDHIGTVRPIGNGDDRQGRGEVVQPHAESVPRVLESVGEEDVRCAGGEAGEVEHAHLGGQPQRARRHAEDPEALFCHTRDTPRPGWKHVGHVVAADGVHNFGAREVLPPARVGRHALRTEQRRVEAACGVSACARDVACRTDADEAVEDVQWRARRPHRVAVGLDGAGRGWVYKLTVAFQHPPRNPLYIRRYSRVLIAAHVESLVHVAGSGTQQAAESTANNIWTPWCKLFEIVGNLLTPRILIDSFNAGVPQQWR
eukprot:m.897632 g.897632  ORF g.897632 m.897632 type:complete len:309 (+) comp23669_c0_seq45:2102-3028(+)